MSKFTIIGDPHAKLDNLEKINQLFEKIEELGNPTIFLGDLLDTKDIVRARCLNIYLSYFKTSKLKHIVIAGNHDQIYAGAKETSLEALKSITNVHLMDEPYIWPDEKAAFIPYIKDPQTLLKAVKRAKELGALYLFGHFDISGFDYGNGLISAEGLKLEDFSGFSRVISGHYHKYQEKQNLTYLGTPFSHSFGEANQLKYIGILDTEKNSLNLIKTLFPRHISVTIDCDKNPEASIPFNSTDYTRVLLEGSKEAVKAFKRISGIKYIEKPRLEAKKLEISETLSSGQQFEKWAKEIGKLDDNSIRLGLEILRDVSTNKG